MKHIARYSYLLASLLPAIVPKLATGAEHIFDAGLANPNPTSQGWTSREVTSAGSDFNRDRRINLPHNVGRMVEGGRVVWQILDQKTNSSQDRPEYFRSLGTADMQDFYENGWEFEVVVAAPAIAPLGWVGFVGWGVSEATDPGWGVGADSRIGFWIGTEAVNGTTIFKIERADNGTTYRLGANSAPGFPHHPLRGRTALQ